MNGIRQTGPHQLSIRLQMDGDFRQFYKKFPPEKLPTGRRVREMMDRLVFCIDGYDDDPREIHLHSRDPAVLLGLSCSVALLALLLQLGGRDAQSDRLLLSA